MSRRMRANACRMTAPAVLDGLVLAAFAATMLTIGGATLDPAAMASLFFGGTIVAIAGSVIVAWTVGDAHPSHHVMAILLGSLATSLVLFLGCVTTGASRRRCFSRGALSCWRRSLDASLGSRSRASRRSRRSGDRGDCHSRWQPCATMPRARCRPSRRPASFRSGRTTRFTVPRSRSSETLTCRVCRRSCSPGSRSSSITMLRTCSRPPLPASSAFLRGAWQPACCSPTASC